MLRKFVEKSKCIRYFFSFFQRLRLTKLEAHFISCYMGNQCDCSSKSFCKPQVVLIIIEQKADRICVGNFLRTLFKRLTRLMGFSLKFQREYMNVSLVMVLRCFNSFEGVFRRGNKKIDYDLIGAHLFYSLLAFSIKPPFPMSLSNMHHKTTTEFRCSMNFPWSTFENLPGMSKQ